MGRRSACGDNKLPHVAYKRKVPRPSWKWRRRRGSAFQGQLKKLSLQLPSARVFWLKSRPVWRERQRRREREKYICSSSPPADLNLNKTLALGGWTVEMGANWNGELRCAGAEPDRTLPGGHMCSSDPVEKKKKKKILWRSVKWIDCGTPYTEQEIEFDKHSKHANSILDKSVSWHGASKICGLVFSIIAWNRINHNGPLW